MTQLDLFRSSHMERAEQWLATPAGREAYRLFIAYARQIRGRGWRKYGAKAIIERVRTFGDGRINVADWKIG